MTAPLTRGQLQVIGADLPGVLLSLNDALRRIRDELDELHGLRGAAAIYGPKEFVGVALRMVDANGTLVHAFGAAS